MTESSLTKQSSDFTESNKTQTYTSFYSVRIPENLRVKIPRGHRNQYTLTKINTPPLITDR